jgi:hypothetical protein
VDAEPVEAWDAPWDRTVRRGLVVGGLLHSVSEGMIKANDLTTLEERSSLELPWEDVASPDPLVCWLLADVSVSSGADGSSGDLGPAGQTDGASAEPPTVTPAAAMGELFRGFLEATR